MSTIKGKVPVASIHAHFNIFRDNALTAGPVTRQEQIDALERHVRWHERQVAVGKELIARLRKQEAPMDTDPRETDETPSTPPTSTPDATGDRTPIDSTPTPEPEGD